MGLLILILLFILVVIAVLILARPKKVAQPFPTEEPEHLRNYSSYIHLALQFIAFYETLPQKSLLVITPSTIGVAIANQQLGASVRAYLTNAAQRPAQKQQLAETLVQSQAALFGGDKGARLFHQLGLSVKLHNNDEDWPFIYMWLMESDAAKRTRYVKDLQKIYGQMYGKRLDVHHLEVY